MLETNEIKDKLLSRGFIENKPYFKDLPEINEMREVIFHYLKSYLNYDSEKMSLKDKISSDLTTEKKIDNITLKNLTRDVKDLVKKFNNNSSTRKIFEKILNTKSINPCEGFYDFRFNLSQDYKVSTGWHQDCETSFIEGKKYWSYLSCTAWIALSNANQNNSLYILPRNKKNSFYIYPQHFGKIGNIDYRNKNLEEIDPNLSMKDVHVVEAKAGECVLLDSFILHRTVPGKTKKPRFSIDIRFYDYSTDLSKVITVHPKVYYFRLLKSKKYIRIRNSKLLAPLKNFIKRIKKS